MQSESKFITWGLIFLFVFLASCQGAPGDETPSATIDDKPSYTESKLERKLYWTNITGQTFLKVFPVVESKEDLLAYKDYKAAEAEKIREMTEERREDLPYFSAVVTFKEPLSLSETNNFIMNFNPTVKKEFKGISVEKKYLFKSDFIKGEDSLAIFKAKFKSTMGGGELPFETLSNPEELEDLQTMIAEKEKELNGIDDYRFVKGITSVYGAVHRDKLNEMQQDRRIFLVDIGPTELYKQAADYVDWKDVYNEVEKFYED